MISKRRYHSEGYITRNAPEHPKARDKDTHVLEHILIAEKALGRYLPDGVVVHHHDEDKQNNANNNLVICEDDDYHKLLHKRMDVLKHGGDPNTEKYCLKCDKVKSRKNFYIKLSSLDGRRSECKGCEIERAKLNQRLRKEVSPKS